MFLDQFTFYIVIFLIFHCLKAGCVPCPGANGLSLIYPPEIGSIVDGSYFSHISYHSFKQHLLAVTLKEAQVN